MVKIIYSIFLFTTLTVFGQSSLSLENEIYNSVDVFVANPSIQNLKIVESAEQNFWKNPKLKTKNELLAIVVLNCNKAFYENRFGKTNQAISSYEKAWQIYQKNKLSNYDIIEYCLKPLGNLYTIIGDYDNAENTIKEYYFIANSSKNDPGASTQINAAVLNLSNVYQSSGKHIQAIELLENSLKTLKLTSSQKGLLWNNLGSNYLLIQDFTKAKSSIETSILFLKKDNNQEESISNSYRNLARIYSQKQQFQLANSCIENARNYFLKSKNQEPRKWAKFEYEKALLLYEQQKNTEASLALSNIFKLLIPSYKPGENFLPSKNSLYSETLLVDAIELQATIYLAEKNPKKALEAYLLAFHVDDLLATVFIYENTKIINQIKTRNRIEKCIEIYDYLFKKEKKITYLENAFLLAERTKSGVLKNYLYTKINASNEEKLLLEKLQNLNIKIVKEQQKGNLANLKILNETIIDQNNIMLSLKKIRTKKEDTIIENSDINILYSKLEHDKAFMVYYFSGIENTYFFTLNGKGASPAPIALNSFKNTSETKNKITTFLNYFKSSDAITNDISGYNKWGNQLYAMLQFPKKSQYKNCIIIPDGLLNFLPFEALITEESGSKNLENLHYLLHDFNIAYNSSATFYLAFDKLKRTKNDTKSILGIFPIFEKTNYELTFSKAEMQSIKNDFEGQFFENDNATFENFKKNAPNYSILHLSTHASPGDLETPASIKFYDQEIIYSELYNLNINPNLVVLSACETGIGKLYKSEGAMSVARGFQFAGAQNLLFSLWKVNDFTTSIFMNYFYNHVDKNETYFEANSNTKLDFLKDKTISNAKKSPYYWSAFVYYGGIETIEKSNNYTLYIVGLLIAIGLFLAFKLFRK